MEFEQVNDIDSESSGNEGDEEMPMSSQSSTQSYMPVSSTQLCLSVPVPLFSQKSIDSIDSGLNKTYDTSMQVEPLACETCGEVAPTIELVPCSHIVCSKCWEYEHMIHRQRVKMKYSTSKRLQEKFGKKIPCMMCPKFVKSIKPT